MRGSTRGWAIAILAIGAAAVPGIVETPARRFSDAVERARGPSGAAPAHGEPDGSATALAPPSLSPAPDPRGQADAAPKPTRFALASAAAAQDTAEFFLGDRMPYAAFDRLPADRVPVAGGDVDVAIAPGALDLPRAEIVAWVARSARAVADYYGRFPARRLRLLIVPGEGRRVGSGRAWGHRGAAVRITLGARATEADLARDWVLVHEMIHVAFPSVAARHHWIEEGLASYVEPVARAQAGLVPAEAVWAELVAGLPKGQPEPGDRGLDHTPTWGRTYWGGALFALVADVEIHRRTGGRAGLQDALRAILAAGNIETSSALEPLLDAGDRATGVPVLRELYAKMKDAPSPVDLDALWRDLGVVPDGRGVRLDDRAPLASIRRAITAPRAAP